ncbi:hypothetical protein B0H34DRAFT_832108 [Crassisporium funariophilum]|nr:hypothetical protein B0H34DRAFT_832108 [Crassisporium funariophilum]
MLPWHTARRVCVLTRFQSVHGYQASSSSLGSSCWRRESLRRFSGATVSPDKNTSSGDSEPLSPEHDIYISNSTNPFFNLTLEDWLFRQSNPTTPLLLIYRDSPCVIIGRNQNPWTEVNFPALRAAGIPFIRRRSGGGTVYHDLGNTNFSIHLPRTSFDRHATGRVVLRAVRSLGIDAHLNDRNDICVGADKMIFMRRYLPVHLSLHVSGSAYKIVNRRAYHHGTMLISTRLDDLGNLLRPNTENIVTKGVASVRSPVCNLQHFGAVAHNNFTSAVVNEFRKEYEVSSKVFVLDENEDIKNIEYIRKGMSELSTWDWAYGQTPEFTHTLQCAFPWGDVTAEIRSKHGVILDCSLQVQSARITRSKSEGLVDMCRSFFAKKRYGFHVPEDSPAAFNATCSSLARHERTEAFWDVKDWLERQMAHR